MAAVDGRRPLSELAIPGTHDSAARHGRLRSRTQTMDVPAQLDAGDEWEVPGPLPAQMNAKWAAVARHLDAAADAPGRWDLTFTSGTGDFVHPRGIAAGRRFVPGINQRLLDYVSAHRRPRRLG